MKRCSTYKLACAHITTDETRAHMLATFSMFVLKLSSGIQSSTCVTLTGNKPQHSLGNHPCSTNAKLTSCSFPLPFIDHFKSSCGCKSRTHSLYTHNPTSLNIVVHLSQDSCQEHIVHTSHSIKWGRNGLLGWKRGPGDDGTQLCSGSTARWGEALNWQKKCGLLTGTAAHCNCGNLCRKNAQFPFQRKPKCPTQQPQRVISNATHRADVLQWDWLQPPKHQI